MQQVKKLLFSRLELILYLKKPEIRYQFDPQRLAWFEHMIQAGGAARRTHDFPVYARSRYYHATSFPEIAYAFFDGLKNH